MGIAWGEIEIGTKVKYRDRFYRDKIKNGYVAGVFEFIQCLKISKIDKDNEFTNTKMDDYDMCEFVDFEDVELFE